MATLRRVALGDARNKGCTQFTPLGKGWGEKPPAMVARGISPHPFPSGVNLAFERLSLNKNWVELNCSNYPNYSIIIPLERLFLSLIQHFSELGCTEEDIDKLLVQVGTSTEFKHNNCIL